MTDNNPWVDAASRETLSERSFSMDEAKRQGSATASRRREERRRQRLLEEHEEQDGCSARTRKSTVKMLHVLDAIVGFSLLVYALVISGSSAKVAVAFVFATSVLLLIRAGLGLVALYTTTCERYGLVLSAYLSPFFGLTLFVLSMLCWGFHGKVYHYLHHHRHQLRLPFHLLDFWSSHSHAVWVTLLAFSVLEAFRFLVTYRLRRQLLVWDDATEEMHSMDTSVRSNHRPWWWRRSKGTYNNDGLGDPLLSPSRDADFSNPHWSSVRGDVYEIHDGVQDLQRAEQRRQRGWLSRFFGGNANEDDDLSEAEFASVHEEWASRSEEDPHWWSRDEDEETGSGGNGSGGAAADAPAAENKTEVSWVESTDS